MVGRLTSRTPLAQGANGFRVRIALLAVVAAVLAIFAIPASANAAMGVTGFSVAPDTTVQGANPNVTASFTRTGTASDDLRDSALHLPSGMTYSIAGVTTKCSTTQFQYDACPSASIVGTTTANATLTLLGVIKFNGTMYGTVYARSNGQIGTIYRPSGFPKVVFSSSLYTSTLTGGVQIKAQNWPRSMSYLGLVPLEVTVGTVRTRYQARSGSGGTGQVIIKNPTTCGPAQSRLVLVPYSGASVTASSSFNVTGCTATDTTPPTVTGISPATGTDDRGFVDRPQLHGGRQLRRRTDLHPRKRFDHPALARLEHRRHLLQRRFRQHDERAADLLPYRHDRSGHQLDLASRRNQHDRLVRRPDLLGDGQLGRRTVLHPCKRFGHPALSRSHSG